MEIESRFDGENRESTDEPKLIVCTAVENVEQKNRRTWRRTMAPAMKRLFEWLGLTDSAEEFDPEYEMELLQRENADRDYDDRPGSSKAMPSNVQVFSENSDSRPSTRPMKQDTFRSNAEARYFDSRPLDTEASSQRSQNSDSNERNVPDQRRPLVSTSMIKPFVNPPKPTVHILYPKRFKDATEMADLMRDGLPVILNLDNVDGVLARRLIDFCSGVTYTLEGKMEKVAESVFLLSPSNVTVSQEERANLSERGVF